MKIRLIILSLLCIGMTFNAHCALPERSGAEKDEDKDKAFFLSDNSDQESTPAFEITQAGPDTDATQLSSHFQKAVSLHKKPKKPRTALKKNKTKEEIRQEHRNSYNKAHAQARLEAVKTRRGIEPINYTDLKKIETTDQKNTYVRFKYRLLPLEDSLYRTHLNTYYDGYCISIEDAEYGPISPALADFNSEIAYQLVAEMIPKMIAEIETEEQIALLPLVIESSLELPDFVSSEGPHHFYYKNVDF